MADFNIRSDSVDVEQIMNQIRARIREKRGVDYTEEQVRELATVRLEKFLDPKNLRSDLLEQFRRSRPALPEPPPEPPPVEAPYTVDPDSVYASHRGALRLIRKLLKPVLKLFINPHPILEMLDKQAQFNVDMMKRDQRRKIEMQQQMQSFDRSRAEWNVLYYEVLHNLVLETTRSGIELKNLKMRVEALASRLEFSERRVRALEGVVQYRPDALRQLDRGRSARPEVSGDDEEAVAAAPADGATGVTPSEGRRRRRRRRGRRPAIGGADADAATLDAGAERDAANGEPEMGEGASNEVGPGEGDATSDAADDSDAQ
jgi:hypothetical protein